MYIIIYWFGVWLETYIEENPYACEMVWNLNIILIIF